MTPFDHAHHRINALFDELRTPLLGLAERFTSLRGSLFDTTPIEQTRLDRLAEQLEPGCIEAISHPAPRLVEGIGLVWVGAEHTSGMLWWRAQETMTARKHHVFNPESDSFYDYRNSVWFQGALTAPGFTIVGPFIDAWGTDYHALTASMKMEHEGDLTGVAAADLSIASLSATLDDVWADVPNAVLLGSEDRVIASNIALLTPGLLLGPFLSGRGWKTTHRAPTSIEGLTLATIGS